MFNSTITKDIEFFINAELVSWSPSHTKHDIEMIIKEKDNFVFYTNQEVYTENLNVLENLLDNHSDKKIYISQSTTTYHKYGFSPIVNLLHFSPKSKLHYNPMKENVIWNLDKNNQIIDNPLYFDFNNKNYYQNFSKSKKGILSVRKQNYTRDAIFNLINFSKFKGIIRYIKVPTGINSMSVESFTDYEYNLNNNPTTSELIQEYCSSYISFIIETDSTHSIYNPITEKTLMGFMTQTLPVVYGGKNFIKELNEMGFYLFNDELGFHTDSLDYGDSKKIQNFSDMIKTYNSLSYSDVKQIYLKNYDKVKKNYDIIWKLFSQ